MGVKEDEAVIEAVLFMTGEPVALSLLASVLEKSVAETKAIVTGLADKFTQGKRGMVIVAVDESYQMCTNPQYFEQVKQVYRTSQQKPLSQTLLETLAIVAYKQPITKGEIEDIRGVDATHGVNRLVEIGLVTEKGRSQAPGKPIVFGTSDGFLKHFGIANLTQLPLIDPNIEKLKQEAEKEIPK